MGSCWKLGLICEVECRLKKMPLSITCACVQGLKCIIIIIIINLTPAQERQIMTLGYLPGLQQHQVEIGQMMVVRYPRVLAVLLPQVNE